MSSSEESIKQDSEEVASAIRERNSANIVLKGGNIARKARRIVTVANKEADNSEDPEFVNNVKDATKKLDKCKSEEWWRGGGNKIRLHKPIWSGGMVKQ